MSGCLPRVLATALALALCPGVAAAKPEPERSWLRRYPPRAHTGELGLQAGLLRLDERHRLFHEHPDRYLIGYKRLRQPNLALGIHAGYYPLRHLGIEAEAALTPARLRDEPGSALVYATRGQIVAQLGFWSVTPFVMVGGGVLGITSKPGALGRDLDPALHFGGGLKLAINRWIGVRVDIRDVVSDKQGVAGPLAAHHLEARAGLIVTIRPPN